MNKKVRFSILSALIASLVISLSGVSYALTISYDGDGDTQVIAPEITPQAIDGTHYFDNFQKYAAGSYKKSPLTRSELRSRGRLDISDAMRFDVQGNAVTFQTRNIAANQNEELAATCVRVGKNCYIYKANNVELEDSYLDRLVKEFDDNIYASNTSNFGSEWKPGIDNDNHVTLLLLDIKDGMEGSNAFVAGYFFAGDEYSKAQYPSSNEREMIYMDVVQGGIKDDKGFRRFCGTIAHEFQHMIHWHNDPKEITWVNESMSQYASFVNGYGHPGQINPYFKMPDTSLIAWRSDRGLQNYGAIYMFSYYLINTTVALATANDRNKQLGFTRALVANPEHGIAGVLSTLKAFGITKGFNEIYLDWLTANAVNNRNISKRFGYDQNLSNYLPYKRSVHGTFPVTNMTGTLDCYGGLYMVFSVDPEYLKAANLGADTAIGGIGSGGYALRISLSRTGELGGNQLIGRLLKVKCDNTYSGDDFVIGPDNNYSFTVPGFPMEYKTLIFTFGAVSGEQLAASNPTYNYRYDFVPISTNVRYMVSAYNQLVSDNKMPQPAKEKLMAQMSDGIMASISTDEGAASFTDEFAKLDGSQKANYTQLLNDIKKKVSFESVQSQNLQNKNVTRVIEVLEKNRK